MIRKAPLGSRAIYLLVFHGLLCLAGMFKIFAFFHTVFYPVFPLLAFVACVVAFFERDRTKWPSAVVGLVSLGLLVHWVVMLITQWQ
jgi:hypothetical protein